MLGPVVATWYFALMGKIGYASLVARSKPALTLAVEAETADSVGYTKMNGHDVVEP